MQQSIVTDAEKKNHIDIGVYEEAEEAMDKLESISFFYNLITHRI